MKKRGIEIRTRTDVARIDRSGDGVRVTMNDGAGFGAGQIMFATGRIPNVTGLGLESAGVEMTPHMAIKVDAFSKSSVPSIYAVGDVTNRVNLTPVAIREGHAFADTVFGGKQVKVDHSLVPTAVFSQPEIGTVGLTEAQARQGFRSIDIYKTSFRPMKHTLSGRDERTLMKLIVDGETDRVLGCHICGPGCGRDGAAPGYRRAHGRNQGRLRRHHGRAPDGGRRTGDDAGKVDGLSLRGPTGPAPRNALPW